MDKGFFAADDLQLIIKREFDNLAVVAGKIISAISNDNEAYSVTVNGIELTNPHYIGLKDNLLEVSGIRNINGKKYSFTQYFPIDGIWQFGVCDEILPPENDHHGNEDDEH